MAPDSHSTDWSQSQPSLVQRAANARDPEAARAALGELYRRYSAPIRRAVERRVPPGAPVDELAAEVWHELLANGALAGYESARGRFRAWIQGVVANVVRAHVRSRARTRREIDEVDRLADALELDPSFVAEEERSWALQIVANALARLAESHPDDVLVLCAPTGAFGCAREELDALASRLRMTRGALHTAATRARGRLRTLLDDELRETVSDPAAFDGEERELRARLVEALKALGTPDDMPRA